MDDLTAWRDLMADNATVVLMGQKVKPIANYQLLIPFIKKALGITLGALCFGRSGASNLLLLPKFP
jgi:hypothetical protein